MRMSSHSYRFAREFERLRATFPVRLWTAALIVACLLTGFYGTAAEPESAFVMEELAPAAQATAQPAG